MYEIPASLEVYNILILQERAPGPAAVVETGAGCPTMRGPGGLIVGALGVRACARARACESVTVHRHRHRHGARLDGGRRCKRHRHRSPSPYSYIQRTYSYIKRTYSVIQEYYSLTIKFKM